MKDNYVLMEELSITSDFAQIASVESLIDSVFNEHFTDSDSYGNILVSVTEAVNNAIIHGNERDLSKTVGVAVSKNDNAIVFTIKDMGKGFDFENLPDPTAPENLEKENGRGIFLMKSLSDGVEFTNGGSEVDIRFEL
jgi:serine/threonine-protein kinase RsbW